MDSCSLAKTESEFPKPLQNTATIHTVGSELAEVGDVGSDVQISVDVSKYDSSDSGAVLSPADSDPQFQKDSGFQRTIVLNVANSEAQENTTTQQGILSGESVEEDVHDTQRTDMKSNADHENVKVLCTCEDETEVVVPVEDTASVTLALKDQAVDENEHSYHKTHAEKIESAKIVKELNTEHVLHVEDETSPTEPSAQTCDFPQTGDGVSQPVTADVGTPLPPNDEQRPEAGACSQSVCQKSELTFQLSGSRTQTRSFRVVLFSAESVTSGESNSLSLDTNSKEGDFDDPNSAVFNSECTGLDNNFSSTNKVKILSTEGVPLSFESTEIADGDSLSLEIKEDESTVSNHLVLKSEGEEVENGSVGKKSKNIFKLEADLVSVKSSVSGDDDSLVVDVKSGDISNNSSLSVLTSEVKDIEDHPEVVNTFKSQVVLNLMTTAISEPSCPSVAPSAGVDTNTAEPLIPCEETAVRDDPMSLEHLDQGQF